MHACKQDQDLDPHESAKQDPDPDPVGPKRPAARCVCMPELELVVHEEVLEPSDQLERSRDRARVNFIEIRRSSVLTR